MTAIAAPARRQPATIQQPDGSTVTLQLHGDEWCHWYTDLQGQLMLPNAEGCYQPASAEQEYQWQAECQEQLALREAIQQQRREQLRARRSPKHQAEGEQDELGLQPHIAEIPVSGTVRGVVLLIEFPDRPFTVEDPLKHYSDQMMKPGYDWAFSATTKYRNKGSVHDYFYDSSNGVFDLQLEVYGPIMMPESVKHYAENHDRLVWEMIVEGCRQIDDSVDFTRFDKDGDGKIDFVASIYAGEGSNSSSVSESEAIWPHQWTVLGAGGEANYVDSMLINTYVCVNELAGGRPDGIGTFCHEFSHIMGLPDHYPTNYSDLCSPCDYDVMDSGCYNLNSFRPAAYSAYERYEMGWLEPVRLNDIEEAKVLTLAPLTLQCEAYIYAINDSIDDPRDGEYYIFENRQPYRWDEEMPGHGMLIWHIDFDSSRWINNTPNNWQNHQLVDLIEADGKKRSSGYYVQTGSTPFPGTANHTSFTADTNPAFAGWTYPGKNISDQSVRIEKPLYNIRELALETMPEDVKDGNVLYDIEFDFLAEISGLQEVRDDRQSGKDIRIELHEGRPVVHTPHGVYDLQGRTVSL